MRRAEGARVVLLGEASHGTREYYTWRDAISRRLIAEAGFDLVAVEGDWPDCQEIHRWIEVPGDAEGDVRKAATAFRRWPTWMWGNEQMLPFWQFLRAHNTDLPADGRVGFHGLDVYSLQRSLEAALRYLEENDGISTALARRAHECIQLHGGDGRAYAGALVRWSSSGCEHEVVALLSEMLRRALRHRQAGREGELEAEQNARVAVGAERYYRAQVRGGEESWNVRDRHMMETLERLLAFYGDGSKAVVWAHNTHVGDARATDMAERGLINLGQLARERLGPEAVVIVGFASHRGEVVAARAWEAPMERLPVPPARAGSVEALLHEAIPQDRLLLLDPRADWGPLDGTRDQRAIGVVYHPEREARANYVPTRLLERYDALVYLDETEALTPLAPPADWKTEPPELWPNGI